MSIKASDIRNRKAPPHVVIDWVFNHLGVKEADLDPDTVPCPGALALWKEANRANNAEWFLKEFYVKTIPSKQQLEVAERQKDDGRALTLLEQLGKEFDDNNGVDAPALPGNAVDVGRLPDATGDTAGAA